MQCSWTPHVTFVAPSFTPYQRNSLLSLLYALACTRGRRTRLRTKASLLLHRGRLLEVIPPRGMREIGAEVTKPRPELGGRAHLNHACDYDDSVRSCCGAAAATRPPPPSRTNKGWIAVAMLLPLQGGLTASKRKKYIESLMKKLIMIAVFWMKKITKKLTNR